MALIDIPLNLLRIAPRNPNVMTDTMLRKLKASIVTFGTSESLRCALSAKVCMRLGGNQRLKRYGSWAWIRPHVSSRS